MMRVSDGGTRYASTQAAMSWTRFFAMFVVVALAADARADKSEWNQFVDNSPQKPIAVAPAVVTKAAPAPAAKPAAKQAAKPAKSVATKAKPKAAAKAKRGK
jgi:hypothetical protein